MAASRNPLVRLEHIRDEIRDLTAATAGVTRDAFLASYVLRRTAEHAVLIVSEAARALPVDLTDRHPGPRWADIRGIGNILRHDYFAVDPRVLWSILTDDLPALAPVIDAMIAGLSGWRVRGHKTEVRWPMCFGEDLTRSDHGAPATVRGGAESACAFVPPPVDVASIRRRTRLSRGKVAWCSGFLPGVDRIGSGAAAPGSRLRGAAHRP